MPKKRPYRYDASTKRHAVEQVLHLHRPVAQVARQLHCSPQSINNWIQQYHNTLDDSSFISASPSPSSKTTSRHTTFLPLQVGDELPVPSGSRIEVVTKNGLILRFPVDTPSDTLIGIVRQLEGVSC